MGGGAWPFLVGGVICLVNSDNERDRILLNSGSNRLPGEWCESGKLSKGGELALIWILGALGPILLRGTIGDYPKEVRQ